MLQTETLFVKVHLSGIEWTRKVVNYSWEGIRQGKRWQMAYLILTCNSFIIFGN